MGVNNKGGIMNSWGSKKWFLMSFAITFFVVVSAVMCHGSVEVSLLNQTFVRDTGKPILESSTFPALYGSATIRIYNGGIQDALAEKVSSATISINGQVIFSPSDFNQKVSHLEKSVMLSEGQNTLEVLLKSKPGSMLTVQLIQTIDAEAAAVIGPEGGVVEVTDINSPIFGTKIEIPGNALSRDETISIQHIDAPAFGKTDYGIGSALNLKPDGLVFQVPVLLTVPYDDNDVENNQIVDEKSLTLFSFDETTRLWLRVSSSEINDDANVLLALLNHFSIYKINGDKLINVNAANVNPDCTGLTKNKDSVIDSNKEQIIFVHGIQLPAHEIFDLFSGDWNNLRESFFNIFTLSGSGYGSYQDTFGCTPDLLTANYQVWGLNYDSWDYIEEKSDSLRRAVSKIKGLTGKPVTVIAHSMGGVVTRRYLQSGLYGNDISKVFLTGTPNHGSPLAEVADALLDSLKYLISSELGTIPYAGTLLGASYKTFVNFAPSFEQLEEDSNFLTELNNPLTFPMPKDVFIENVYTDNIPYLNLFPAKIGDAVVSKESVLLKEFENHNKIYNENVQDYFHVKFSWLGWETGIAKVECVNSISCPHETWLLLTDFLVDEDKDGFPDFADNCPIHANTDQNDSDDDGIGDACDTPSGIILNETFDNLNCWQHIPSDCYPNQHSIQNGVLVSTIPVNAPQCSDGGNPKLEYVCPINMPNRYEMSFDVRLVVSGFTGWGTASDFATMIHWINPSNFVLVSWRQNECNDFDIGGVYGSYSSGLLLTPYNFNEWAWHTVKLVKDGAHFEGYINDTKLAEYNIPAFEPISGGTVRIYLGDGTFEVDNVIVKSLDTP